MKGLNIHSLRSKIIFSLIVIATIFLGIFQAYTYYLLKVKMLEELNESADQKIERLGRDLDIPMWELDESWIQKLLQSELMDENVHAIVVSGDQNILVSVDRDNGVKKHKEENTIVRIQPILHDGVKIGAINLYLTKELMEKKLLDELIDIVVFTLFEIIAIILFLWISLRRVVIQPLEALIESTQRIANGDYTHKEEMINKDEIGALSISIYQMQNKIQTRESEILLKQEELENLKERLEYAVNGTGDGLWDWNLETNECYFSPRWKSMLGYEDSELPNEIETWEKRIYPPDLEKVEQDVVLSQQRPGLFYENIHRMIHKDGHLVWMLDRGQTLFNTEGKAVRMVGFDTDITKQKQLEHELLEQEQMMIAQSRQVAMGEMIGMIAHQWRQPITVIAMGANNILADIALEDVSIERFAKEAEDILKQTEYLSKTIDDFRNFFRPNKEKDEIKAVDVLFEAKQIMGKSFEHHNIELSIVSDENEMIYTYSRELLQVVLNLLKNSKEALETSETENAYINASVESLDNAIIIRICDNGGGIDASIMDRIFEPYFSTKDKKTGTGLGLYMSKTIIEKHLNGSITAINTDDGVCFIITISKESTAKGEDV